MSSKKKIKIHDPIDELNKLHELKEKGIISQAEYEAKAVLLKKKL